MAAFAGWWRDAYTVYNIEVAIINIQWALEVLKSMHGQQVMIRCLVSFGLHVLLIDSFSIMWITTCIVNEKNMRVVRGNAVLTWVVTSNLSKKKRRMTRPKKWIWFSCLRADCIIPTTVSLDSMVTCALCGDVQCGLIFHHGG